MAVIRNFRGLRPAKGMESKVAELPYDVVSRSEARSIAEGNEASFFRITRPEIELPDDIDPYDARVYEHGRQNLENAVQKGLLVQDKSSCLYLYSQVMDGRMQTGLVAAVSIDDYKNGMIKKHELTREDKERDRIRHLDTLDANTGPVFLIYREDGNKRGLFKKASDLQPVCDFTSSDGIRHIFRVIDEPGLISDFISAFGDETLYIADGHHRAASAVAVGDMRRKAQPGYTGEEEFNRFLAVVFPHDELRILPYNRAVKDLNGRTSGDFLKAVSSVFRVEKKGEKRPSGPLSFCMYLEGGWYTLHAAPPVSGDPVEKLDVSILQNSLLMPVLGIKNPRNDNRISFIGGIRGTAELEKLVDSGEYAVAFSLFPTGIEQLIEVSDAGGLMPPKSTWFEPKLRSGLVVHYLRD